MGMNRESKAWQSVGEALVSTHQPLSGAAGALRLNSSNDLAEGRHTVSRTDIHRFASVAGHTLEQERNRSDHPLRPLVGTAKLLVTLLVGLGECDNRRDAAFNIAIKIGSQPKRRKQIKWMDKILEEFEGENENKESEWDVTKHDGAVFKHLVVKGKAVRKLSEQNS